MPTGWTTPPTIPEKFMTHRHLSRSRQFVLAAALIAALGTNAYAQGPGPGAGRHGHGGPKGPFGEPVAQAIAQVKEKLALNSSQQVMWDNAVAATKAVRGNGRMEHESVHAAIKAELAKPEPDLAAIASMADEARAKGQASRLQVRKAWLDLYATFSPAQKQVVAEQMRTRMERMEGHRARMMERRGDMMERWGAGKG